MNIKDFTTLIYTYIHWKINNLIFVVEYLRTKTVLPQCLVKGGGFYNDRHIKKKI